MTTDYKTFLYKIFGESYKYKLRSQRKENPLWAHQEESTHKGQLYHPPITCNKLGTPKTHTPLVLKAQAGPTHHSPILGSYIPVQTKTLSPRTWVLDSVRCKDLLHQKETLTVGPERARTHDKRATSLPSAHTQVCAWDNKSVTCLESYATADP